MSKLIDMHFHLDFYSNHSQVYKQINQLEQHTLCVTNQPEIFETCIELYQPTNYVQFGIGFHPQNAGKVRFGKAFFIRNLSTTKYVGEVGLDFSKEYLNYKNEQIEIFDFICKKSCDKIMSVHCRMAEQQTYEILKKNGNRKVIIHWYSGNEIWLEKFINLGAYFSVNFNMMGSVNGKQIIKRIPMERIFVESDGPFTKVHGKRYSIEKLGIVYDELAGLKGINDAGILSKQIAKNYLALVK